MTFISCVFLGLVETLLSIDENGVDLLIRFQWNVDCKIINDHRFP